MSDYSKLKVQDLKDKLQERSLSVSGKKDELIARLTEDDRKRGRVSPTQVHKGSQMDDFAAPDEDFDFDDDAHEEKSTDARGVAGTQSSSTKDTSNLVEVKPASAVRNHTKATEIMAPETVIKPTGFKFNKVSSLFQKPRETTTNDKPTPAAEFELERRKKRAERFGLAKSDAEKAMERAVKFGVDTTKSCAKASFGVLQDPIEAEKAKKRAERFGLKPEEPASKKVKT